MELRWGVREVAGFKVILRKISDKMYFRYPAKDEIILRLLEIVDVRARERRGRKR